MAVNNNFYLISNELFSRATGKGVSLTQVVDYQTFVDNGKKLADLLDDEPELVQNTVIAGIMNKVQKTLSENPSYRGALIDMYRGTLDYGILEIIMHDFYASTPSTFDGDTLTEGQTYTDQFKVVNIAGKKTSTRYVTNSDSYGFDLTVRDTDIKGIFDNPDKFDGFIRETFISVANSNERHKELQRLAVLASIIKSCAATTAEDEDENAVAKNYDVLAIYNEEKGTELTQANCFLNNDFVSWTAGLIRDIAILMSVPSSSYNLSGDIVTFTPEEYRKLVINGVYDKALRRSLIDAYNKDYGMIDFDYEVVPYWQIEGDRMRVTTNETPSGSDPVVTTYSPYVLAVLYDRRACGEMTQLDAVTTDRNGGRRYTNYHWQFNNVYWTNPDANTIIFTIGSEPVGEAVGN